MSTETESYRRGRELAEFWIRDGGDLDADGPDTKDEAFYNGFIDTLHAEKLRRQAGATRYLAPVIPLFPPKAEEKKPEPPAQPANCSFCHKTKPAGKYISDGQIGSPVICFECVVICKQRLDESDAEDAAK